MKLDILIVRHGPAGDPKKFYKKFHIPDDERPLTSKGLKVTRRVARYLRFHYKRVDCIYTSPFKRAKQTAEIIHNKYESAKMIELAELAPGYRGRESKEIYFDPVLKQLRKRHNTEVCVIVGHEPDLSQLLSFILTGRCESFSVFKKGGFAHVHLEWRAKHKIKAQLQCLMSPSQMIKVKKE